MVYFAAFPIIGSPAPAAVVDLAVVAVIAVLFVAISKPFLRKIPRLSNEQYDAAVQGYAVFVAAGLIALDLYASTAFAILSSAVIVATGAVGANHVISGKLAPDPVPPATPDLSVPTVDPAPPPAPSAPPAPPDG